VKSPTELRVRLDQTSAVTALAYRASRPHAEAALILGHGAGAGQRSPFMTRFAAALAALGVETVTFDFLYTEQKRRIPDRRPALEACYRAVINAVLTELESGRRFLFIGGKSMGGRIATHVAVDPGLPVAGVVLLGYPLHPPGRPDDRRDSHLAAVGRPILFVQGSRDAFGTPAELEPVLAALGPSATLHVVTGGDHSLKVRKLDATEQAAVYDDVQRTIVDWIQKIIRPRGETVRPPR
jgi:predicted alpha/beta-hydrolase family hydrolase